jgi:hypothetical protein
MGTALVYIVLQAIVTLRVIEVSDWRWDLIAIAAWIGSMSLLWTIDQVVRSPRRGGYIR